jgi:hypothetical protein
MRNTFIDWINTMGFGAYTLKITTAERNAEMKTTQSFVVRDFDLYRHVVGRRDVGAVYITAECGCVYIVERDEHYVDHVCPTHFILNIIEEARYEKRASTND